MGKQIVIRPDTEENRTWGENVHPSGWTNPTPADSYNLVVLGAGTAGLVTAAGAAGLGAKVALIEREFMGGDCLNVGCVPSKGIIRASRAFHDARTSGEFGVEGAERLSVDFGKAMPFKEELLDPTDRASLESNRNFTLRIRDRERRLIGKLNEALERIEDGTFGICEACEEPITQKRLEARPVTTLCIRCKEEQEMEERSYA